MKYDDPMSMINFNEWVESRVMSISMVASHEVHIGLEHRGVRCHLRAEGVDRLLIDEFREQNVVESIRIWGSGSDTEAFHPILAELISGAESLEKVSTAFRPTIDSEILAIRESKKVLLQIEPVYGARVLILAKNVTCY